MSFNTQKTKTSSVNLSINKRLTSLSSAKHSVDLFKRARKNVSFQRRSIVRKTPISLSSSGIASETVDFCSKSIERHSRCSNKHFIVTIVRRRTAIFASYRSASEKGFPHFLQKRLNTLARANSGPAEK